MPSELRVGGTYQWDELAVKKERACYSRGGKRFYVFGPDAKPFTEVPMEGRRPAERYVARELEGGSYELVARADWSGVPGALDGLAGQD